MVIHLQYLFGLVLVEFSALLLECYIWLTVNMCARGDVFIRFRGIPYCSKECVSNKSLEDIVELIINE